MRWISLLLIILIAIPISLAYEQDYNNYSSLQMSFEFTTDLEIKEITSNPDIDSIEVNINTFPKETESQIINNLNVILTPQGDYDISKEVLKTTWLNPDQTKYKIKITADIDSDNTIYTIDKPINFPSTSNLHSDFTKPSTHIDTNTAIRKQAQELAGSKIDYYQVTFDIAKWVKQNIEYKLTTKTSDEVQDSSWVLENKIGVCDELTNLFISMVRSVDIPARFVTGMAYSNIKGEWEAHAWAEVYFPEQGWVPFDVTYGQFGWLDPTHIKLSDSLSSGVPSTTYQWKASGVELKVGNSEITTKLTNKKGSIPKLIAIDVNPLIKKAGPGSFIPLEVVIKNGQDIYLPENIMIIKAPEVYGANNQYILLKPNEVKKLYWILKAPEDLENGYMYTSEIEIRDIFHISNTANLSFATNYDTYTKERAEEIIAEASNQKIKESASFDLNCKSADYVYLYDVALITCTVNNKLEATLDNVRVCAAGICEDLVVENSEEVSIEIIPEEEGFRSYIVKASYKGENIEETETFNVLSSPDLRAIDLVIPNNLDYKEDANITFVAVVQAPVKDVHIIVNDKEVMAFDSLSDSKKILIRFNGESIYPDKKIIIDMNYKDENGKDYQSRKEKDIIINNIPWYIKFLNFFGLA